MAKNDFAIALLRQILIDCAGNGRKNIFLEESNQSRYLIFEKWFVKNSLRKFFSEVFVPQIKSYARITSQKGDITAE